MKLVLMICFGITNVYGSDIGARDNLFAANIYKELPTSNLGNFLVCPLSAETILALVHSGAGGNTAKEISSTIRLPDNTIKIQDVFLEVSKHLDVKHPYELTSANKIYVSKKIQINNEFKETAVGAFRADIENVDFENVHKTVSEINKWTESKTNYKIKNVLKSDDIDQNTVSVLINTIYFKGDWITQFDQGYTSEMDFFITPRRKVKAKMMSTRDNFNYYDNKELNAKFLELPFVGDDVTMTIVLPDAGYNLATLENRISEVLIRPSYTLEDVDIAIPKFKIETNIQFIPILEKLGIMDAFKSSADFRGISNQPMYISKVAQKAFIEINERGATATASTVFSITLLSLPQRNFIANRPFIFYLRHKNAGILFVGRFVIP